MVQNTIYKFPIGGKPCIIFIVNIVPSYLITSLVSMILIASCLVIPVIGYEFMPNVTVFSNPQTYIFEIFFHTVIHHCFFDFLIFLFNVNSFLLSYMKIYSRLLIWLNLLVRHISKGNITADRILS